MLKISHDVAESEIQKWLDKKKIYVSVREKHKDTIQFLSEAISNGDLLYDEVENSFTHKLLFQTSGESPLTELKYKGRLNDNMLRPYLKGIAGDDGEGRLVAVICALTESPRGIITALDSLDKKIAMSIAIFFL